MTANEDGIIISRDNYRDIVMIAGKDPCAYKGVEDVAKVHVRPSGEGGCEKWLIQGAGSENPSDVYT